MRRWVKKTPRRSRVRTFVAQCMLATVLCSYPWPVALVITALHTSAHETAHSFTDGIYREAGSFLTTPSRRGATELIIKPCRLAARICCTFSPTSFSSVHVSVWHTACCVCCPYCTHTTHRQAWPPSRESRATCSSCAAPRSDLHLDLNQCVIGQSIYCLKVCGLILIIRK